MKANKIAIILTGDFRTWEHAAENIFAYADAQDATVDFFFSTWNSTKDSHWPEHKWTPREVTDEMVTRKFVNHNLVAYKLSDPLPIMATTYYYQCYLNKIGNILKRQNEIATGVPYDLVLETRPDIFLDGEGIDTLDLEDFQFTNAEWFNGNLPLTNDFYMWTNSFTNDLLAGKYVSNPGADVEVRNDLQYYNHWLHYKYHNSMLLTCKIHKLQGGPIRPNIVGEKLTMPKVVEANTRWMNQLWT